MEELAEVVAIDGTQMTLVSQVKSSCNSCTQVDSCASGQIAKAIPHKKLSFTLAYPQSLASHLSDTSINIGDCVVLMLPEVDVLRSAWQVYLSPLVGLFTFSAVGQLLLNHQVLTHELQALLIGVLGGYLGYRLAKYWQNKPDEIAKLQPEIIRVLPKPKKIDTDENVKPR